MKYMALIYTNAAKEPQYGTPEGEAMMAQYKAATAVYIRDGVLRGGDALQPASAATTVRVRGGKTETLDGPFAETKEQLGGFYIFECADLDAAIKYAAMIPGAAHGGVEVRPMMGVE